MNANGKWLAASLAIPIVLAVQLFNITMVFSEEMVKPAVLQDSERCVDVDSMAKLFALKDTQGKTFKLAEFRGKKAVLLYFWATWCPHCVESIENLRTLRQNIPADELEILAVNVGSGDSLERVKRYQQKKKFPFPMLYDEQSLVSDQYGVEGIPLYVLIDADGKILYRDHALPE